MTRIPLRFFPFVIAGLLAMNANVFAQDTNFWIFLCFGQSNMEGFPEIQDEDKTGVDERFKVFAAVDFPKMDRMKGKWYPAVPPLCRPRRSVLPIYGWAHEIWLRP